MFGRYFAGSEFIEFAPIFLWEGSERTVLFDYFYGSEAEQFSFYRIPKKLFKDEEFKCISAEAKVLYGLMLDRMGLSVKNRWLDGENRVYIIYTIDDITEDFGCARQKAAKLLNELEKDAGLIERKRQGLGKPNIIYVKNFVSSNGENQEVCKSNFQKYENHTSRNMNTILQEVPKSYSNNTNINNTEINKTDRINHLSINQSNIDTDGWIDGYNKIV